MTVSSAHKNKAVHDRPSLRCSTTPREPLDKFCAAKFEIFDGYSCRSRIEREKCQVVWWSMVDVAYKRAVSCRASNLRAGEGSTMSAASIATASYIEAAAAKTMHAQQ